MNASDTSPTEGHECDGESAEEIVRSLLQQRIDGVHGDLHKALVEARADVQEGRDVEDALKQLRTELEHAKYAVEDALEALDIDE